MMIIILFLSFEKVTNLQIDSFSNETQFPVVTIRFRNWLNYEHFIGKYLTIIIIFVYSFKLFLFKLILAASGKIFIEQDVYLNPNKNQDLNENFLSARNAFMSSYLLASISADERIQLETGLANNSIISCRFNGILCSQADFKISKYENEGAFIQFNINKSQLYVNKFKIHQIEN
jgi:hypothetical protein